MFRVRLAPVTIALTVVLFSLAFTQPAAAFQIEDPIHINCHERITQEALDVAGYAGEPPSPSDDDRLLLKSAQFELGQYDDNTWAWSLMFGVRYPDLKGSSSFDFDDLSRVHNGLDAQDEHCLRSELQDGPSGDLEALNACRAIITALYWEALTSLDDDGNINANVQTFASENLMYAGRTDINVSEVYFATGKALHAIQDSFTHTYRDPEDFRTILHVFNWSDQVSCTLEEETDGHGHESLLDDCEGTFDSNSPRLAATTEASAQFLEAIQQPGNRSVREQRLQQFLDDWFTYVPGCTLENDYCDHPEHAFLAGSEESDRAICGEEGGCASTSSPATWLAWALLLPLLVVRRGRRRTSAPAMFVVLSIVTLSASSIAFAQDATAPDATPPADAPPAESGAPSPTPSATPAAPATPAATPVATPPTAATPAPTTPAATLKNAKHDGYRTEVRASMSLQNPGAAIGVAAGYRWLRCDVGGFLEVNPWFSVERSRVGLGTTNLGAFVHYLHPISDDADLRFGAGGGAAILNESLAGSPAGKIGPYLNLRLLGVVLHGDGIALTIDGFDLAVAAPQMVGWPVIYAQHRVSVGVQF